MSKQKSSIDESWEIKDRLYTLLNKKPLTLRLNSKHSLRSPLLFFDEANGSQRELRYATNMSSPFVDEQKGTATLGHIVFESGRLFVPKEQQNLQKLLSLYHPKRDREYAEYRPEILAESSVDTLELEVDAMIIARELEIDHAEAILRVEIEPALFLELANDEKIQLRNVAILAAESRIIKLSEDQRTFSWASNGRKLMTVPFEENAYSAMAAWFQTDEGLEVYKSIQKKLK